MRNRSPIRQLQKNDMQHLRALQKHKGKHGHPYTALLWLPVLIIALTVALFVLLQLK